MKKPRKSRNPKKRIKRSRRGGRRQRNLRYKTLKKKGGARIKLDSKSSTATALIAGYQQALSSYVDALKQDNQRMQSILSGEAEEKQFDRLLKITLAKGIAEEVERAQAADKNVLQKVVDGITSIFTRGDAGAKQSFAQQLNDIVEREKLVFIMQTTLKYDQSSTDSLGKQIINAINSELQSMPDVLDMMQRFGFGVGMDPYFDLEISKQEVIVDKAINNAADKVAELRLRLDTVTDEQKNELKVLLDDVVDKINKLLAMFSIFSGAGGGRISILDYQNQKLNGFGANPASTGAMAFSMNQKVIHEEVLEAITKKINEAITFYPNQDVESLINTSTKTKDIGTYFSIPQMKVNPVSSNPWKTGRKVETANTPPIPVDPTGTEEQSQTSPQMNVNSQDEDITPDPDARSRAEERMSGLEQRSGIATPQSRPRSPAPNVGVGPQSDEEWDDGGDQFESPPPATSTSPKVSSPKPKKSPKAPSSPVEIEMSDFSKRKTPEESPQEDGATQQSTTTNEPTATETGNVSEEPEIKPTGDASPPVSNVPVNEATVPDAPISGAPASVNEASVPDAPIVVRECNQAPVPDAQQEEGIF